MGVSELVLSYKHLKLKLRVFLTGYTIAVVTNNVNKITTAWSLMTGHLIETITSTVRSTNTYL